MSKSEVKPREFYILDNGLLQKTASYDQTIRMCIESENKHISLDGITARAIEYSAYENLKKENEELKAENAKLKEYKAMYEGLCK